MLGILDKLKFKIDLFTIGKIILKLIIFKKIVALIAILCLLLFLPSLKHKETESSSSGEHHSSDEEDVIMMRKMGGSAGEDVICFSLANCHAVGETFQFPFAYFVAWLFGFILADEKISNVAAFVLEAIEGFPKKVNGTVKCDGVVCKSRKLWKYVDKKINDKKYAKHSFK